MDIIYSKIKVMHIELREMALVESRWSCVNLQATGPETVAEYMRECLIHPAFVSTLIAKYDRLRSNAVRGVLLCHRATTCRRMCLERRGITSPHLKLVKSLERYTACSEKVILQLTHTPAHSI